MKKISVILLFTLAPMTVFAHGWYAGLGFGQSSADEVECSPDYTFFLADISCSAEDSDTGLKLFGGYMVNPNAAFEFSYYDFGEFTIDGTDSVFGNTELSYEASGVVVSGVGLLPINERIDVIGKLGLNFWDVDAKLSTDIGDESESDSGTEIMFGIGASFKATDNLALRVEWEQFNDIGDDDTTGQSDVELLSASIVLKF